MKHEDLQNHLANIVKYLADELSKLRIGRATPALLEGVLIEAYPGSPAMPINELGNISTPDAQSILIEPWDKSILKKIEDGIRGSGKGLNPVNEGGHLRVPIPMLTEERRKEMAKEISRIVEQAKIRVRTLRQDAIKAVEEQQDNGIISEDDMFRQKKEIEAEISKINAELDDMGEKKEKELMTI